MPISTLHVIARLDSVEALSTPEPMVFWFEADSGFSELLVHRITSVERSEYRAPCGAFAESVGAPEAYLGTALPGHIPCCRTCFPETRPDQQ